MKLRIRDNTLRLRLTRSEVDRVGSGGSIEAETHFMGGSILRYTLSPAEQFGAVLNSEEAGSRIAIEVPTESAKRWAEDETRVCLSGDEPFSAGPLEVLIEKDFTCVTPRTGEEELDTFPNPSLNSGLGQSLNSNGG